MSGLTDSSVIDALDRYELLVLGEDPRRDGQTEDSWDAYEVSVGKRATQAVNQEVDSESIMGDSWSDVSGSIFGGIDRIGRGSRSLPPLDDVDALAWYQQIHYYGSDWGIFVKEASVLELAAEIGTWLDGGKYWSPKVAHDLVHSALAILYLHEAFHHKVESFAIRLEMARISAVYVPYMESVFGPSLGSDQCLEEGIACAEMISRLSEPAYSKYLDEDVFRATSEFLESWIPRLSPGYRMGVQIARDVETPFANRLQSMIAESSAHPSRPPDDWAVASQMLRGLFTKANVVHVVVAKGHRPLVPWAFGGLRLSVSSLKAAKFLERSGFNEVKGGKGSHRKFRGSNGTSITLPANRESLTPGVLSSIARSLGMTQREFASACR